MYLFFVFCLERMFKELFIWVFLLPVLNLELELISVKSSWVFARFVLDAVEYGDLTLLLYKG